MSTSILALLVTLGLALPVVLVLSRSLSAEEEQVEETAHDSGDCRHCAALAVPPGLVGSVHIPRQSGGDVA